jgi:serine/threonine protein kinase
MTQEQFFARYKYDVEDDLLGGGGFGQVYKAFDETRNRYVAIKVSPVKKDQESLSLKKEVDLAASLPEHKNVAHYESCERFKFHLGTFDYGILQYYPLGNLSQLVQSKKMKDADKELIAQGIVSGIHHLHSNNVVHRDLKSANILMAEGYQGEYVPKIADFGLSKQFTENEKSYFSNSFAGGSLLYVAPEQLEGKELRKNVDLWSLGVVLYELFVGETPFKASVDDGSETARAEIISKIKNASIPAAITTVPSSWQEVIRGCLMTDPAKRTKSIEDVISTITEKLKENKTNTSKKIVQKSRNKNSIVKKSKETAILEKKNVSSKTTEVDVMETTQSVNNDSKILNKESKYEFVISLVFMFFLFLPLILFGLKYLIFKENLWFAIKENTINSLVPIILIVIGFFFKSDTIGGLGALWLLYFYIMINYTLINSFF